MGSADTSDESSGKDFVEEPQSSATTGAPHMMTNIRGESFNLYGPGSMEFLRVPFEAAPTEANLTVLANVEDIVGTNSQCKQARYITSVLFGRDWVGDRKLKVSMREGEILAQLGGDPVDPSGQEFSIGNWLQLKMPNEEELQLRAGDMMISLTASGVQGGTHHFL